MKGGYFYERRTKQLSLFFIGVVFTTIVVWSWEKTPLLTTLLPSHSQVMQLFPGLPSYPSHILQFLLSPLTADGIRLECADQIETFKT